MKNPQVPPLSSSFWIMVLAKQVSTFGSVAAGLALSWYLLGETGRASAVSTVLVPAMVFCTIAGPLLAPLGDRYSRKLLSIVGSFWSGLMFVVMACAASFLDMKNENHLWLLSAIYVLESFGLILVRTGGAGIIPSTVPASSLARAMRLDSLFFQLTNTISSPLGGFLISVVPVVLSAQFMTQAQIPNMKLATACFFLLNAVSFLIFSILMAFVKVRPVEREIGQKQTQKSAMATWFADLKEGALFVLGLDTLICMLLVFALINFGLAGFHAVGVPFLIKQVHALEPWFLGVFQGTAGVGAVAGSVMLGALLNRGVSNFAIIKWAFLVFPFATGASAFFLVKAPWFSLPAMFLQAAAVSLINTIISIQVLTLLRDEMRARVMSLIILLSSVAAPLGIVMSGFLIDTGSWPVFTVALFILTLFTTAGVFLVPGFKVFSLLKPGEGEDFVQWRRRERHGANSHVQIESQDSVM